MPAVEETFIDWLLESGTPTIRHLALTELGERSLPAEEVRQLRAQIREADPAAQIFSGQTAQGCWRGEHSFYTPKYLSTHWSMLLLTELGVAAGDPGLRRGAQFMLEATADGLRWDQLEDKHGYACFYGNLLRYARHAGLSADRRFAAAQAYLLRQQSHYEWRCPINADLPCAWGVARALYGIANLPPAERGEDIEHLIADGLRFLLADHPLVAAEYPMQGKIHPLWFRLNFPLFYQADILFVLRVAGELGALGHPGTAAALDWLAARRQQNGRWRGASPYRRRTWSALTEGDEVNRWVSLQAALIEKQARLARA